jgi:tRNA(adenine34) deaminase
MAFPLPEPMRLALEQARDAALAGEVPVGAVVSRGGDIIAAARNMMRTSVDPTAHAEIAVLRMAGDALGSSRLDECDLWVTLEPCAMCAGAIGLARIGRLYFGAPDPKGGAVLHGPRLFSQPTCHHSPEIYGGIGEEQAGELLRSFFLERRAGAASS